jgi:glycosyltransferase involved in cell wall biosynthesis
MCTNHSSEAITVILPIYRENSSTVHQTLLSIANQTQRPNLVFVIDDCPGIRFDSDFEYFRKALDEIPMKLYKNESNMGLARSLNNILPLIETKYWARVDAGDICDPERFKIQCVFMEKNPKCGLLGGQVVSTLSDSKISNFPQNQRILKIASRFITCVAHPTFFARTESLRDLRYPDIIYAQDFGFVNYVLKQKVEILNLGNVLVKYSNTASHNRQYKIKQNACLFVQVFGLLKFNIIRTIFSNKSYISLKKLRVLLEFFSVLSLLNKGLGRALMMLLRIKCKEY